MDRLGTERIESFKAGLVGGISTALVFLLTLLLHRAIAQSTTAAILPLPTTLFTSAGLVSVLAAGITGFLFGVTYRYIVRQDANPQLRAGAVLAFFLVRGLAQIDVGVGAGGNALGSPVVGGKEFARGGDRLLKRESGDRTRLGQTLWNG